MNKLKTVLCFALVCILLAGTASAAVTDSADNRFDFAGNVIADRNVTGDYVAIGQNIKLEAGVKGDIIAIGRAITITDQDAVQNIFALGQYVTVRAKSARNIYATGADVTVSDGTDVKGAYLCGVNISFGGTAQDAYMAGASVTEDGTIYGDLTIRSDHITFGRNATVGGHLTVIGTVKPQLPPNIDPAKMTFKRVMHPRNDNKPAGQQGVNRFKVIMAAVGVVTAVILALLMTLFRGGYFKARALEFRKRWWKDLLFGIIAFIVMPVAALVCMLTIFAIPIGVIVLAIYAVLIYLAPVITGMILGRVVLPRMSRYLSAGLGAAVIELLMLVPILKLVIALLCAFYTLGITVVRMKPRRENNPPGELKPHE
ncbi:hypothetical protein SAMN02745823_03442 [Sporobacter termitidis DSM 10068]|uniref:DUF8173 domain-containing protein n=1 Tax=Sporobacter termitidis DSM 10068 TaxID=1123282 RepID=A0A1M5ZAX3_9FIRM|nr:hypothetical protein [Sporobacter termitidis]SHI21053.1 hypothetical protein SAMN02745823_03442 [Sporobacter termitidis DSM 10068]